MYVEKKMQTKKDGYKSKINKKSSIRRRRIKLKENKL